MIGSKTSLDLYKQSIQANWVNRPGDNLVYFLLWICYIMYNKRLIPGDLFLPSCRIMELNTKKWASETAEWNGGRGNKLSCQETRASSKRNRHIPAREEASQQFENHQNRKTKAPASSYETGKDGGGANLL